MAAKKAPKNFTGLLDDVQGPTAGAPAAKNKKGPLLTFYIDEDLKPLLDRVVFWNGRSSSQRAVINDTLRKVLMADPKAQRPTPDEEKSQIE